MKVLIIEDTPTNIELIKLRLEFLGCDLLIASDLDEAVSLAREEQPAFVLSDLKLYGDAQRGIAIIEGLKATPETAHIPIYLHSIFVSHRGDLPEVESKVDGFLMKPFKLDQLRTIVETHRPESIGA